VRVGEVAVALNVGDLLLEVLLKMDEAPELRARVALDFVAQEFRAVLQGLIKPPVNLVHLLAHQRRVRLQGQGVLLDLRQCLLQSVQCPSNLHIIITPFTVTSDFNSPSNIPVLFTTSHFLALTLHLRLWE
jgi:hypothetical protein